MRLHGTPGSGLILDITALVDGMGIGWVVFGIL